MATRYGYSRTFKVPGSESIETFSVESANSFDEAQKVVNKGIYDRELELKQQTVHGSGGATRVTEVPATTPSTVGTTQGNTNGTGLGPK